MEIAKGKLEDITRAAASPSRSRPDGSISLGHSSGGLPSSGNVKMTSNCSGSFEVLSPEPTDHYHQEGNNLVGRHIPFDSTTHDTDPLAHSFSDSGDEHHNKQASDKSERTYSHAHADTSKSSGIYERLLKDVSISDPKLREPILRMQKLDKILASKISREKKVKHETKKLVERLRQQLDNLNNSNRRDSVAEREKHNFMAVATCEDDQAKSPSLCDRNNEEMEGGESDYLDPTITPVFQTQVIEESRQKNDDLDMKVIGAGEGSVNDEDADRRKRKSSNDSFIRRNIQLAGDAASIVAMTDDEKKRVEDLLQSDNEESLSVAEDMEACIAMRDGEGYSLDHEQLQALLDIDMQLQNMLSAEDFQANSSHKSVSSCASQQSAGGGGSVRSERESALVLQEQYDMQKRALAELERRLLKLQEHTEIVTPLPRATLDKLLEECEQFQFDSIAHIDDESPSLVSSQVSIRSSHTSLPDDVLQKLLREAKSLYRVPPGESLAPSRTGDPDSSFDECEVATCLDASQNSSSEPLTSPEPETSPEAQTSLEPQTSPELQTSLERLTSPEPQTMQPSAIN